MPAFIMLIILNFRSKVEVMISFEDFSLLFDSVPGEPEFARYKE